MGAKKSVLERMKESLEGAAKTVVETAKAVANPTAGTPMRMPRNESGADIRRAAKKRRPAKVAKPARKSSKKAANKATKRTAPKNARKSGSKGTRRTRAG